ncbi:MAG TPA: Scr1 family TA system antitoxin-like transcriptional regulator, partial [Trebonia sp.]|nr:Scr1 family TA system antitoxin-like transcriptional regulator [Trebonia sp.]
VLYRPFGGARVMRAQLDKVLEMSAWPRFFIQVAKFSETDHPGMEGPLRVLFYPDSPTLAYTESRYTGKTSIADSGDAATNFDLIRGAAMSPDDSVNFIRTVKEDTYGNE